MDVKKISDDEIKLNLSKLTSWEIKEGKLHKLFKFKTFNQALSFMVGTGMVCEKMNHHPEWSNVYGNVDVKLVTHRVAGLTELDFKLAENMDKIAGEINLRKD
ncbi:MAG: 4a-hydroxytetrahydrobiopterin dehydratase [Candidatus Melainabacteria bacterium]|nr:4a-hydroxytetrahydrobiopterin dehydratase [Candidatus Melainabacteria bacterium]